MRLPQWGMGMDDATIVAWLASEGDRVVEGEPLVEVEAAKANATVEAPATGVLARILAQPEEIVLVRAVIAVIDSDGEAPA